MAINQYVPFATGDGANTLDPATYAASPAVQVGFTSGVAKSVQVNTALRQASVGVAALAQFILNQTNVSMLDDGNVADFAAELAAAIQTFVPNVPAPQVHVADDTSINPTQITASVYPAPTNYQSDHVYVIGVNNACTGPCNANFNGLGNRPIVRNDFSALQNADWPQYARLVLIDNGTTLSLIGLTVPQIQGLVKSTVAANPSLGPARSLTSQTTAGTYSFTVPAGVTWVYATVVGAGGGGAGGAGSSTWSGGGGGSGGTAEGWVAVTPGQAITYVVGAGGNGGTQGNGNAASSGSTSSFGAFMSATGGGGGIGGTATCTGGQGGQGSGGQENLYGSSGGDGNSLNQNVQGGAGGSSSLGGGGRTSTISGPVADGHAPGSGGGGIWQAGGPAQTGGHGADGAVFISY